MLQQPSDDAGLRSAHRSAPPSGTVTFLFTDIEGSTVRWDRDRSAMEAAVRVHDAIMRAAIAEHGGYVFKTIGDAFCAAFDRPEDAANATVAAQRALGAADFAAVDGVRVRMAVHTGTADERDGDYFGPAVNRVARLLAIGHGSQVLLSGVTADLVQGILESHATLRDLGEHRLKDLSRPEYVYQLLARDLPADFPPLRSLDTLANNLPLQMTSFVGRETEVSEITELLAKNRLVTLVGSGGIGKTRTALQVAAHLLDGNGDGVWFVELAPLTSGDYIPTAIAAALGLKLSSEGDPLENLVRLLAGKHALLVFDNCEHLVEPIARIVSALVRGCPRIEILTSSRQGLGVAGERMYRMPSLPQDASIALFVERAQAVDQRFVLTDDNASIVADICRRLDGIALAIELAAPRINILNPRQLRDKLDERFRVLTGGSRDVLPRQQTLRALIDWSHDLLDARERALFCRLSIFVDGFTIEGATAVGSGDDLDEFDVFDLLASLVDKSLVLAEPGAEAVRYRLLESTRAYSREKLEAAGGRERCAQLHLKYLHDVFVAIDDRSETTGNSNELHAAFASELEDVRVALDGALRADVRLGAALLAASNASSWTSIGLEMEMAVRVRAYLEILDESEGGLRAGLYCALATVAFQSNRATTAMDAASSALAYARISRDVRKIAWSLTRYAVAATALRLFDEAESAISEAEAIRENSTKVRYNLLHQRASLAHRRGDHQSALLAREKFLAECRKIGDRMSEQSTVLNLAEIHHSLGNTRRSVELMRELLLVIRSAKDRSMLGHVLTNFAAYLAASDDFEQTLEVADEAIGLIAATNPSSPFIAMVLEPVALALAMQGDSRRAALLEGYADATLRQAGFEREFTETTTHDRLRAHLADSFAADDLTRLLAEGAVLSPEAAIALALDTINAPPRHGG